MFLSELKPPPKPKAEEEAEEVEEDQEAEAEEAEAEDALSHLRRKIMRTLPKTQGMIRVFGPAVDEPPRLCPRTIKIEDECTEEAAVQLPEEAKTGTLARTAIRVGEGNAL